MENTGPAAAAASDLDLDEVHARGPVPAADAAGQASASPQPPSDVRWRDPLRGPPPGRPPLRRAPAGLDLDDHGRRSVPADRIELGLRGSQVTVQDAPAEVPQSPAGQLLPDPAEPGGVHRGLTADPELQASARGDPEPEFLEGGAGPPGPWTRATPGPQVGPGGMTVQSRISLMAARE